MRWRMGLAVAVALCGDTPPAAAQLVLVADTGARTSAAPTPRPKTLSLEAQRRRAALRQRVLLQQQHTRQRDEAETRQLERLQLRQLQSQQDRRDVQSRQRYQLDQAIKSLQQPAPVAQPPRLGPAPRPMIEQMNPSCGVPNTPICR